MDYVVVQHRGRDACSRYTYYKKPKPHKIECRICHKRYLVMSPVEFQHRKRAKNAMVMVREAKSHRAARELIKHYTDRWVSGKFEE